MAKPPTFPPNVIILADAGWPLHRLFAVLALVGGALFLGCGLVGWFLTPAKPAKA